MSLLHADEDRTEVTSYVEAFFIFVVFAFILIMLYPKEMIKEQVLSEKSNYDLTATYLTNMLKIEPKNTELMVAMVKVSINRENVDLAQKLLKVLENNKNENIKLEVYDLKYRLLKAKKELNTNPDQIDKLDNEMIQSINLIANEGYFKDEDTLYWYSEAISLSQKEAALKFIEPAYKMKNDPYLLEQCVYLATQLNRVSEQEYCLDKLRSSDVDYPEKWLIVSYSTSLANNEIDKALKIASELSQKVPEYKDVVAKLQLQIGHYKESSDAYMILYDKSSELEEKTMYLIKALASLQNGSLNDEAATLARQYEDKYLHNKKMSTKLIQVYLSTNHLEDATRLSSKVLNLSEK